MSARPGLLVSCLRLQPPACLLNVPRRLPCRCPVAAHSLVCRILQTIVDLVKFDADGDIDWSSVVFFVDGGTEGFNGQVCHPLHHASAFRSLRPVFAPLCLRIASWLPCRVAAVVYPVARVVAAKCSHQHLCSFMESLSLPSAACSCRTSRRASSAPWTRCRPRATSPCKISLLTLQFSPAFPAVCLLSIRLLSD